MEICKFSNYISVVFFHLWFVCLLVSFSLSHTNTLTHTQGDKGLPGVAGPPGPVGRPGSDGHAGPMGPKVEFQPGSCGSFVLRSCAHF